MYDIILPIPDHFVDEYKKDCFQDSLKRCLWCLQDQFVNGSYIGRYEIETLYMLYESLLKIDPVRLRDRIDDFIETGKFEDIKEEVKE